MELLSERPNAGAVRARGPECALFDACWPHLESALQSPTSTACVVEIAGRKAWLKASHLRGWARTRHSLANRLLGRALPRERELNNLGWLRERFFPAPQPWLAGHVARAGAPRFQFLFTEYLGEVTPLDEHCAGAPGDERAMLLRELAAETARLHALHFVHRDLYPRNLLVRRTGSEWSRRLVWIDAWRGGAGPGMRGSAHDLATLFLDDRLLTRDEQRDWLHRYLDERERQGRPAKVPGLLARARRARRRLVRQLERDPRRLRGAQLPSADWDAAALVR